MWSTQSVLLTASLSPHSLCAAQRKYCSWKHFVTEDPDQCYSGCKCLINHDFEDGLTLSWRPRIRSQEGSCSGCCREGSGTLWSSDPPRGNASGPGSKGMHSSSGQNLHSWMPGSVIGKEKNLQESKALRKNHDWMGDGVPHVTLQRWGEGEGKEAKGNHSFWAKRGFQLIYHEEARPLC